MTLARILQLVLITLAVFGTAMGIGYWQSRETGVGEIDGSRVGGRFELTNHNGARTRSTDFAGKALLIYFGYTYCPDVCPTELARISQAIDLLGEDQDKVVPIFITIDPQRDTPPALADYVPLFHPNMIGLTGSEGEIATVARDFRVFYSRVESDEYADYLMNHSSFVYLQSPGGENLGIYTGGISAQELAGAIAPQIGTL